MMPLDQALRDLQAYQVAEAMEEAEFTEAKKRMQEIGPAIKAIVATMDVE
jgi:hypothetical protein